MIKGKFELLLAKGSNQDSHKKPSTTGLLETLELKYTGNNRASKEILKKGFDSYQKQPSLSPVEIAEKYVKERNQVENLSTKKVRIGPQTCVMCENVINENEARFKCEGCP